MLYLQHGMTPILTALEWSHPQESQVGAESQWTPVCTNVWEMPFAPAVCWGCGFVHFSQRQKEFTAGQDKGQWLSDVAADVHSPVFSIPQAVVRSQHLWKKPFAPQKTSCSQHSALS